MCKLKNLCKLSKNQEAQVSRLAYHRDKHVRRYEICMIAQFVVLFILAVIFVISGITFIGHNIWANNESFLKEIKKSTFYLIISYAFLLILAAGVGIYTSNNRKTSNGSICCFQFLLVVVIAIPLLAEGSAILELDGLTVQELRDISEMNLEQVISEYNALTVEMIKEGIWFD